MAETTVVDGVPIYRYGGGPAMTRNPGARTKATEEYEARRRSGGTTMSATSSVRDGAMTDTTLDAVWAEIPPDRTGWRYARSGVASGCRSGKGENVMSKPEPDTTGMGWQFRIDVWRHRIGAWFIRLGLRVMPPGGCTDEANAEEADRIIKSQGR